MNKRLSLTALAWLTLVACHEEPLPDIAPEATAAAPVVADELPTLTPTINPSEGVVMAVPSMRGIPAEGQALVGSWIADIEFELNDDVPPEQAEALAALAAESRVAVEFGGDGSMTLVSDLLGEHTEQPGRWSFMAREGDVLQIRQVPYVDGAVETDVRVEFLEPHVIEITQGEQRLTFYRERT